MDHLIIRDDEVWTRDPAMWLAGRVGYTLPEESHGKGEEQSEGRGLDVGI